MSRIIFVFLDGVGLGPPSNPPNPFWGEWPGLGAFSGGRPWVDGTVVDEKGCVFRGIDACLGLEGLPQSGTGQAALFTGVNAAALAGRHYGPFPHSANREAIRTRSLFARLGPERSAFANAYPPRFFSMVSRTDRWSVTTRACLDANVHIRTLDDLAAGNGVSADMTGQGLHDYGLPVAVRTPEESADALIRLAEPFAFTLFEVFHTDKAGHARDLDRAMAVIGTVDRFLGHLAMNRPADATVVVSSDHGNLEDLSVKTHTRNEVPLAALGPAAGRFRDISDLTGVTPAIMEAIGARSVD